MNTAAKHEAGHAVAIHFLGLAAILRPGGAAVTPGGGGVVALDCTTEPDMKAMASRFDCNAETPCAPPITAAQERPDLIPAILLFMLAGYGATPETWQGNFGRTICVRTSSDFNTAKQILSDLIGEGWLVETLASEVARDALDRAVIWAAQPCVRLLIDRVAAHLDTHGAATWKKLENLFSVNTETARRETLPLLMFAPGEIPLAGDEPGTVAGCSAPVSYG